jgi:hypothetical protein
MMGVMEDACQNKDCIVYEMVAGKFPWKKFFVGIIL